MAPSHNLIQWRLISRCPRNKLQLHLETKETKRLRFKEMHLRYRLQNIGLPSIHGIIETLLIGQTNRQELHQAARIFRYVTENLPHPQGIILKATTALIWCPFTTPPTLIKTTLSWIGNYTPLRAEPLLLSWFNIPAWISNHIPTKIWDEITYPIPNFNGLHRWSLGIDK